MGMNLRHGEGQRDTFRRRGDVNELSCAALGKRAMMRTPLALAGLVAALMASVQPGAGIAATRPGPPLEVRVPQAPATVVVEGRRHTVFEIHLANLGATPLILDKAQVRDGDTGAVLASFAGPALEARLGAVGAPAPSPVLAPGAHAVIFAELDFAGAIPRHLEQVITGRAQDGETFMVKGGRAVVTPPPRVSLGPPLRGGPWVAVYQADWPRGHRRVFYTLGGISRLPGRLAIDWVKIDADGHTARGDPDQVAAALGYGAEVLAVADGVVAATRDDVAQSARVSQNPRHARADAAGNFIALRLEDGRYAVYEHLRPGSLLVEVGQIVRKGQVIGQLGFTGDSTGPHLHFHVADAPQPLGGEGVGYALEAFTLLGRYRDIADLGMRPWEPLAVGVEAARENELPDANVVVRFAPD
jgi:hypothetical protein